MGITTSNLFVSISLNKQFQKLPADQGIGVPIRCDYQEGITDDCLLLDTFISEINTSQIDNLNIPPAFKALIL